MHGPAFSPFFCHIPGVEDTPSSLLSIARCTSLDRTSNNSDAVGGPSRGYPAISRSSSGLVRHAICTAVRMFRSTAVHFRPQRLPTSQ